MFETGKVDDLRERVHEIFELLAAQEGLSPEMLRLYYHAMLHVVYPLLHQNNVSIRSLYPGEREPEEAVVTRSLSQLKQWTLDLIDRVIPSCTRTIRIRCRLWISCAFTLRIISARS